MSRVSARNTRGMVVLLLFALVPVVLHSYIGFETDECANATTLVPPLDQTDHAAQRSQQLSRRFRAYQFRDGTVRSSADPPLHYAIVRSYDAKLLYYRAERRLIRKEPLERHLDWIEVEGHRIPIHRLIYPESMTDDRRPIAAYLLLHGGRPIENPYLAQLAAAPMQLVTGQSPMTLMLAFVNATSEEEGAALESVRAWLASSWQRYQLICLD